MFTSNHKQGVW